ncbi:MAG: 6-phosphogluconolactonase, partial [Phycisphaerae bacterium]|nr:6-phosphogluconolactonase [Phycisphaerae bacterium]
MSKKQESQQFMVEPTAVEATRLVANLFESIVCEAVAAHGTCHLALAGGTTPHALYQVLADQAVTGALPWSQTGVFFGDERDVPQDHVESNYHMAQRTLLDNVPIEPSRVYPMPADAENLETAAGEYEQVIRKTVTPGADGIPQFDLILLGMGGDGHTASIFPYTDAVKERKKLVMSHFVPVLGRNRMTFTFPLINAALNVILLVTGED